MSEKREEKEDDNDKYLSVSIDVGELMKRAHLSMLRGNDKANFYFSKGDVEDPSSDKPLFKSGYGAVWLNESNKSNDEGGDDFFIEEQ